MNRSTLAEIAAQTIAIVERGHYEVGGRRVDIGDLVSDCLAATRFFSPETLATIRSDALARPDLEGEAAIEVRNETTLAGIARLLDEGSGPVGALNFASAKNPGGGFLKGSHAQEETLARSSSLHASLLRAPEYHEGHRGMASCLYTDAMIASPDCPIFRDDDGRLFDEPSLATFLSAAAPNAGAIAANSPKELRLVPETLRRRADLVFALATHLGLESLVLGAWGCGVFRNDPTMVAATFAELLGPGGPWSRTIPARSCSRSSIGPPGYTTLAAFERAFPGHR